MIEKKMYLLGSDVVGEWVMSSSRPEACDEDQEVLEGTFRGTYCRPECFSGTEGWTGWFYDPDACLYLKIVAGRSSGQWVDDIDDSE